jgi:DNA-directed RNA polymerase specialized sigma subunit
VKKPPPTVTPEQRARFDEVADVPAVAVRVAVKHYGRRTFQRLEDDAMLSTATLAVMEAAATYDPAKGSGYRDWAFFSAIRALLEEARDEAKHYARVLAVLRAGLTVHAAHVEERIEIGVDGEDELSAKLGRASDGFYARSLFELAASDPPVVSDAEEDQILHEAAVWAGDVLRKVLATFQEGQRTLLELHFARRKPLTKIAAEMAIKTVHRRTFYRHFHQLISEVGVRLRELGMIELPPWSSELSGTALGESPTHRHPIASTAS